MLFKWNLYFNFPLIPLYLPLFPYKVYQKPRWLSVFLLISDTFWLFIIFCHLKCTKFTPIILNPIKIATSLHLCYKRHFMFSKSCTCLFDARTVLTVSKIDFWKTHIYIFPKKTNFLPKIKKNPRRSSFLYSLFIQSSGSI